MLLNSASQKMDRKLEMKRWWINLNTKIKINKRRSCSNLNVLESKRIIYTWAIMHSWKKLNSRSFRYYYVCSAALQGLQCANIAARNIRWILHTLSPLIHVLPRCKRCATPAHVAACNMQHTHPLTHIHTLLVNIHSLIILFSLLSSDKRRISGQTVRSSKKR